MSTRTARALLAVPVLVIAGLCEAPTWLVIALAIGFGWMAGKR